MSDQRSEAARAPIGQQRGITSRDHQSPDPSDDEARHRKRRSPNAAFTLVLLAPSMLLLIGIIAYPLYQAISNAFFSRSLLYPTSEFVGLRNIISVLSDSELPRILWNTAIFTIGATALSFALGFVLALILNERIFARGFLRSALILPWLLPGVVVSFLWSWIFDGNFGVLDGALRMLGLTSTNIGWLHNGGLAMLALIVAKAWHSFPWMMIMMLAGLQAIPQDIQDAAAVDGAGRFNIIRRIVVPQLKGVMVIVLMLETIWNLQQFEMIYVMTGGGPAGATKTLSVALYQSAFQNFSLGQSGAYAVIWIAILTVFVLIYLRFDKKAIQ